MKGMLMMMPVMRPPMMETAREMARTVNWMPAWFTTMITMTILMMMTMTILIMMMTTILIMMLMKILMMTWALAVYPGPASTAGSSA